MSSLSKKNVKTLLQNARNNPTRENFLALHKSVVQYIDAQLADAYSSANGKLEALTKELETIRAGKANANTTLAQTRKELEKVKATKEETDASLAKMQQELESIKQALLACKSTEAALSKRAEVINDSMNVVKSMMRRNNTAMVSSPSSK
jgi:predicted  nucleic acid-binding Zn-ribbon protein